jgi:hypothetical protein
VCLAKELFGHESPGDDGEVHFHLAALDIGATTCTARLVPRFWDKGDYFTTDFTMTEELYLYAHFEPKATASAGCSTFNNPLVNLGSLDAGFEFLSTEQASPSIYTAPGIAR